MALEEFEKKPMSERHRGVSQMRTISNYVAGVMIIGAGCFFMFSDFLINKGYDPDMVKVLAIVCWVYGIFRIYRGYQKNYFND